MVSRFVLRRPILSLYALAGFLLCASFAAAPAAARDRAVYLAHPSEDLEGDPGDGVLSPVDPELEDSGRGTFVPNDGTSGVRPLPVASDPRYGLVLVPTQPGAPWPFTFVLMRCGMPQTLTGADRMLPPEWTLGGRRWRYAP